MPGPLTSEREGRSASGVTVVGHPLRLIGGIIYRLVTTNTGTRACSVSFRASSGVIFTTRIEPSSDITTCFFILLILSPLLGLVISHDLVRVKYSQKHDDVVLSDRDRPQQTRDYGEDIARGLVPRWRIRSEE